MTALPLATTDLGSGQPVIVLHGLFGRRRNWQGIQKRLADKARIITVDLRNHGDSPWSDDMSYPAMAEDIAGLIDGLQSGPALVVGHSMGGKAAMTLALSAPEAVKGLMVVDIAPVAYGHQYAPYIDAMRNVPLNALARRSEAESHLEHAITDPGIRAFLLQNLGQDDDGLKWQVNLDAIEHGMTDILDFPGLTGAPYEGPAVFLSGGNSDFVQDAYRPAIESLFPMAAYQVIDDAGHWVHAEKPAQVIAAITAFIDDNDA